MLSSCTLSKASLFIIYGQRPEILRGPLIFAYSALGGTYFQHQSYEKCPKPNISISQGWWWRFIVCVKGARCVLSKLKMEMPISKANGQSTELVLFRIPSKLTFRQSVYKKIFLVFHTYYIEFCWYVGEILQLQLLCPSDQMSTFNKGSLIF